jgi:tetratricopeptide (TPR) repeat protein
MTEKIKRDVKDALETNDLNRAVDRLKTGLRRKPYWEWGHRTLGDIYLDGLEHSSYALVQYRKLREVKESLTSSEKLRLAWAYEQRGFMDQVSDVLADLDPDDLPERLELVNESYEARTIYDRIKSDSSDALEEQEGELFEKHRRKGDEHREYGNFFEAQKSYEKALEFRDNPEVTLALAQCLIQRSNYPAALEYLKSLRSQENLGEEAEELITEVYERLGLNVLFDANDDDEDRPGQSRKVS